MITVRIRFYEELNDFIRNSRGKVWMQKNLNHHTTVKDVIESFGVPHTEVDLILVNGDSVEFNHHVNDGDIISVYPVFESLDISKVTRLQQRPLRDLTFLADVHLGKLVKKLRILGLDVIYRNNFSDEELVEIASSNHKILLTRDRRLLMHNIIRRGLFIRSQNPDEQVLEVVRRFDLTHQLNPFSRCSMCNELLHPVKKADVLDVLEPKTKKYYHAFVQCEGCHRVYWKGSHFTKLIKFIRHIQHSLKG